MVEYCAVTQRNSELVLCHSLHFNRSSYDYWKVGSFGIQHYFFHILGLWEHTVNNQLLLNSALQFPKGFPMCDFVLRKLCRLFPSVRYWHRQMVGTHIQVSSLETHSLVGKVDQQPREYTLIMGWVLWYAIYSMSKLRGEDRNCDYICSADEKSWLSKVKKFSGLLHYQGAQLKFQFKLQV